VLPVKNYNELRPSNVQVPRILVVVKVPGDEVSEWMECGKSAFEMRDTAYWLSLRDLPETANSVSVTVPIPSNNLFSPDALSAIFERLKVGELP
jgi:hypothetical protein